MKICGFQKTTLLDYPGHLAAAIFTGGCNFRCPFCQNSELVSPQTESLFSPEEVLAVLKKRKNILEGVCITGGEPTLQPDLEDFIRDIRSLGLSVKLDTNGFRPQILQRLCEKQLLDYVAMDIKSSPGRYPEVSGIQSLDIRPVEESVAFLKAWNKPYEFRTTVVHELHKASDFKEIGPWIAGAPAYYLQNFMPSEYVPDRSFTSCSREELRSYLKLVEPYVGTAALRGID